MTATVVGRVDVGRHNWSASRDKEGHRIYKLRLRAFTTSTADGPERVFNATGLPAIGSIWQFGNDVDAWAFCTPEMTITPVISGEPNTYWDIEQTFSTVQPRRCQDESIEDPLLEPHKISGSFTKTTEEAAKDKDGNTIESSSHEQFRGPQVEFDKNRPTVVIEHNVASLGLSTFSSMVDTLNNATLWGLSARKIKLSNVAWSRKLYGLCNFYYTRRYEFDIDFDTFDRDLLDEGNKVLKVGGDVDDPRDFTQWKDNNGENGRTPLDGAGNALADAANPVFITIQKYTESNFLLLGIPTTL